MNSASRSTGEYERINDLHPVHGPYSHGVDWTEVWDGFGLLAEHEPVYDQSHDEGEEEDV